MGRADAMYQIDYTPGPLIHPMATLRAFLPIDMQSYVVSTGNVTSATGDRVQETRAFVFEGAQVLSSLSYAGKFSVDPFGTPSGIYNEVVVTTGGMTWFTLGGAAEDLQKTFQLLDSGALFSVMELILGGKDDLRGSDGDDVLDGLGGDDLVHGGAGDDTLWGFDGDDTLLGGPGNDRLEGEAGHDVLDGGPGHDIATYSFVSTEYSVLLSPTSIVVRHLASPGQDTDTLIDIEEVYFAGAETPVDDDLALDLLKLGGARSLDKEQVTDLVEMYVAYFDRAPDAIGLHFWGTALASGSSMEEIATLFFTQPETKAAFPNPDDAAVLVDTAYLNVLERDPDPVGRAWWIDALESGAVSRAEFMLALLEGARANAEAVVDVRTIEQKGDIGLYYGAIHGLTDADNARLVMAAYDRDNAADSLAAARTLIDGFAAAAAEPSGGREFTMPLVGVIDDPFAGL